jgi:eukaryotic-like serine/threonine-protein kinase
MNAATPNEEDLFDAARLIQQPAEQQAFLKKACGGDQELQSRLENLLHADRAADEFFTQSLAGFPPLLAEAALSPPLPGSDFGSFAEEKAGARIGRYRVMEKIGEGGCGVVYMAEQVQPVRRQVALKVIKLGMDTMAVIARFEAERQALAMMDHPNIATVLDAGATDAGRPYFVMELVRGLKITEYCDLHQLGIRDRLNLFTRVCHAIQHAHQKGVVHRDIKPSNILVTERDGVPMPKVIDFGIAKATETELTEKTILTGHWQILGTPAYMSPEHAEIGGLDVDTRSDIYSLGVLLYELLTDTTPFDPKTMLKAGIDEMRRALREDDPPRPSKKLELLPPDELREVARLRRSEPARLLSQVRGDLDWVVMKALEKDRTRRYETANGLAMDIQRHLNNEPVNARPPSRIYQFQKLVRRNKALFAAVSAVTIAVLAGLGTSSWLYFAEREARQRAVVAEKLQVELRKEAEAGRAGEALLREQAEIREKITQAVILLRDGNTAAADKLSKDLKVIRPTLEGAEVFRTLGDWHAVGGRWKDATDRFSFLLQVNQLEWQGLPSLDYIRAAAAWIELGDDVGYNNFRHAMIARFANSTDSISAERVIKCCLMRPCGEAMIASVANLAAISKNSVVGQNENEVSPGEGACLAWRMLSIGLMEYRLGNFSEAEYWARRCLDYKEDLPTRIALGKIQRSMALYQLRREDEAMAELHAAREMVEAEFEQIGTRGWDQKYFWFDWVIARIQLSEAESIVLRGS